MQGKMFDDVCGCAGCRGELAVCDAVPLGYAVRYGTDEPIEGRYLLRAVVDALGLDYECDPELAGDAYRIINLSRQPVGSSVRCSTGKFLVRTA